MNFNQTKEYLLNILKIINLIKNRKKTAITVITVIPRFLFSLSNEVLPSMWKHLAVIV